MDKVIIINNYNYAHFLKEALGSIENQKIVPDKVIVVDDGSTDESVEFLKKYKNKSFELIVIEKQNGGQLSCFNSAISLIESNDVVFFLDSDDLYPCDYIDLVLREVDECHDFYFVNTVTFRNKEGLIESAKIAHDPPISIPISSALTRLYRCWIGSPTSGIAIKGHALKEILPYKDERSFVTRADDVLVYSSSILGHSKKYLPSLAISYRIHANNKFYGKKINPDPIRDFAIERLFNCMTKRAGVFRSASPSTAYWELKVMPKMYRKKFFIPSITQINLQRFFNRLIPTLGIL